MANWQESKTVRMEAQRRRVAESLKRCPLCDAINAMSNEECFMCSWHGAFDHDPARVEAGLDELIVQCPELADAMLDSPTPPAPSVNRLRTFWHRIFACLLPRWARRHSA